LVFVLTLTDEGTAHLKEPLLVVLLLVKRSRFLTRERERSHVMFVEYMELFSFVDYMEFFGSMPFVLGGGCSNDCSKR